jgi:predicted TIM-barrel fold metal-dependent hydrolase
MIVQGVFDKYPALQVLLLGASALWIPSLLWRFDTNYKGLRRDAPWMKQLPSEYFMQHVRVGTNPLDKFPSRGAYHKALRSLPGLETILCYSSGYPNWDSESPNAVIEEMPAAWLPGIMHENATRLFRLEKPSSRMHVRGKEGPAGLLEDRP